MFLVILRKPRARFPFLVGSFPKKEEARAARNDLLKEGIRKGETVEIVNALNYTRVYAPESGTALEPNRQRKACAAWLDTFLRQQNGAIESERLRVAANAEGFSDWTLRHATKLLAARSFRKDGRWWTELASSEQVLPETPNS